MNKLQELVFKTRDKMSSKLVDGFEEAIFNNYCEFAEISFRRYVGISIVNIDMNALPLASAFDFGDSDTVFMYGEDDISDLDDYNEHLNFPISEEDNAKKIEDILPILKILEKHKYIFKFDDERNLVAFVDTEKL